NCQKRLTTGVTGVSEFVELAISCVEDKLVQRAVSDILNRIYEPLFLPCFLRVFRPGLNCHDALKALQQQTFRNRKGAIVEIDIRKYFDHSS
ncbi:Retron-type reverse transcriptase, partial [Candidatus Regiella insecticola 5.15]